MTDSVGAVGAADDDAFDIVVPRSRNRRRTFVGIAFVVVAAVFFVLALRGQRKEITAAVDRLSWESAVAAEITLVAGLIASLLAWRVLLASLGSRLRVTDAARIFYLGQLGKYLPGSVWPVVAQMEMGKAYDVPRTSMFWATAIAMILALVSGAMLGVTAVPALASNGGTAYLLVLLAVPVGLVILHPRVLNRVVALATRVFRRQPLEHRIALGALVRAFLLTLVTWLCNGLHVLILARSIGEGSTASLIPLSFGGFAIAWVAGFLFLLSPAGVGVRETILILALGTVMTTAGATAVALISRLLLTAADGIVALIAVRVLRGVAPGPAPAGSVGSRGRRSGRTRISTSARPEHEDHGRHDRKPDAEQRVGDPSHDPQRERGALRLGKHPERLERALFHGEPGAVRKVDQAAPARRQHVVDRALAGATHVAIRESPRQPAQQRQTVVRLEQPPLVRNREVHDSVGAQDAAQLSEMTELLGAVADVFDHVIRDGDVERPVGEWEARVADAHEVEPGASDSFVAHVDGTHEAVRSHGCCDLGGHDPGPGPDLDRASAAKKPSAADERDELRGLAAPALGIEQRV